MSWNDSRRLYLVTAPTDLPVTLQEAKDHLRVDGTADEVRIGRLISSAVTMLDAPTGLLGGCIVTQTWKMTLRAFPYRIEVPLPPLQSVDSVKYIAADGTLTTIDSANYQVAGLGTRQKASIVPVWGYSWPCAKSQPEAVVIQFTAGYAVADVPEPIKEAVLQLVEMRFDGAEVDQTTSINAVRFLLTGLGNVYSV